MPKNYDRIGYGQETVRTYNYVDLPPDYHSRYYLASITKRVTSIPTSRVSRSFSGVTTPNYKTFLKAHGFLPTTTCQDRISKSVGIESTQSFYGYWDGRLRSTVTSSVALSPESYGDDFSVVDLAASKLRRKVLDQDVNVGVVLAEAKKTSDMIYDTARRIALAIRALRKGDLLKLSSLINVHPSLMKDLAKDLKFTKRDAHSYWLEMQYGWKPLLQDVEGAAKAFAKTRSSRASLIHVSASTSRQIPHHAVVSGGIKTGMTGTITYTGKCWITYKIRNDLVVSANRLGLLNPLSIAWELVPFSFVADWFINVGDYIEECSAFTGIDVLDSGNSYKRLTAGTMYNGQEPNVSSARVSDSFYKRWPGVSATPKLMFKNNPFSKDHVLNAVALLREVTKR